MGIKVSSVLELPLLRDARLVAGAGGLDKHVEGISLIESPESEAWLAKNNLVLNNTAALERYDDRPERLVDVLHERGITCVAFKLDRFYSLPDSLLRRADELDLPVIVFPYSLSASQLISAIMYEIIRSESPSFEHPHVADFLKSIVLRSADRATLRKHMATLGWTIEKSLGLAIVHRCADVARGEQFAALCRSSGFPYLFCLGANAVVFTELDGEEHPEDLLVQRTKSL